MAGLRGIRCPYTVKMWKEMIALAQCAAFAETLFQRGCSGRDPDSRRVAE